MPQSPIQHRLESLLQRAAEDNVQHIELEPLEDPNTLNPVEVQLQRDGLCREIVQQLVRFVDRQIPCRSWTLEVYVTNELRRYYTRTAFTQRCVVFAIRHDKYQSIFNPHDAFALVETTRIDTLHFFSASFQEAMKQALSSLDDVVTTMSVDFTNLYITLFL